MSDTPNLTVITSEPRGEDVVTKLEQVLASARAGEISAIAIATVTTDGSIGRCWSKIPSYGLMLGAVHQLAHLLSRHIAGDD